MKPFGLYSDIRPALDRSDIFLARTTYAAEPEPYLDLLHFPEIEPGFVAALGSRVFRLKLASGIIPSMTNFGIEDGRYFLAFTLGLVSAAATPLPLRGPVGEPFWKRLLDGLRELHGQGFIYGHLAAHTVARTDQGAPMLFDVTGLRSLKAQGPDVDIAALTALRDRYADSGSD